MALLDKMRTISNLIEDYHLEKNFLEKVCEQLSELITANIYVYDDKKNIIVYSVHEKFYCQYNEEFLDAYSMPKEYMDITKTLIKPVLNTFEPQPVCTNPKVDSCIFENRYTSIIPIFYSYKRVGAILLIKYNEPFSEEDQILCEHIFAIISLEFARKEIERIEKDSRQTIAANIAFNALSYSEEMACKEILDSVGNGEGIIVASEIADKLFLTRSTVNNTLKKLESAGIIQIRSLGVKGTYIKILNETILNLL